VPTRDRQGRLQQCRSSWWEQEREKGREGDGTVVDLSEWIYLQVLINNGIIMLHQRYDGILGHHPCSWRMMKGLKADPFDFAFIFNIGGRTLCRKHPRYGFFCIQLERTLLLCASKIRLLPGVQDLFLNYYANPTWPRQLKQTSKRECHRGQRNHICKDSSLLLFHPPSIMAFAGGQCRWRMRWRTFDLIGDPFFDSWIAPSSRLWKKETS